MKRDFELGICEEQKAVSLKNCYSAHTKAFLSNFSQRDSINVYPYNSDYQINKNDLGGVLSAVWTKQCGLKIGKNEIKYFCLDHMAKMAFYYGEIGQDNNVIGNFAKRHFIERDWASIFFLKQR